MVNEMKDEKDCLILQYSIICISAIPSFNKNLVENGLGYHLMVM